MKGLMTRLGFTEESNLYFLWTFVIVEPSAIFLSFRSLQVLLLRQVIEGLSRGATVDVTVNCSLPLARKHFNIA